MPKFTIKGEWSIEIDTPEEAVVILGWIENAAAQKNCELEDSSIEDEDGEVLEESVNFD